jgi:UDPglucose 6-dehydrogenase
MIPKAWRKRASSCPRVEFLDGPYEAAAGAHALVLLTEWNAFRALDLDRIKLLMAAPVVVDLRNVYDPAGMKAAGFTYASVGRPDAAATLSSADR